MPHGYWPVVVRDDIGINVPGVHLSDGGEKAFALLLCTGSRWTMTLSHEIFDLLADPFGKTFLTGSLFWDVDHEKPPYVGPNDFKPKTPWEIHPIGNRVPG